MFRYMLKVVIHYLQNCCRASSYIFKLLIETGDYKYVDESLFRSELYVDESLFRSMLTLEEVSTDKM